MLFSDLYRGRGLNYCPGGRILQQIPATGGLPNKEITGGGHICNF